jgi:Xaa-Pro dipeptidase
MVEIDRMTTGPFPAEEFAQRRTAVAAVLADRGLDALVSDRAETIHYLTSYDPRGDAVPPCVLMTREGATTLVAAAGPANGEVPMPAVDVMWPRSELVDANGADELARALADAGLQRACIGVEGDPRCPGLGYGRDGRSALAAAGEVVDVADAVDRVRAVKSPLEMACIRRAAGLADDACDVALAASGAGVWEGDALAALVGAILRGGGEDGIGPSAVASGPFADRWGARSRRRVMGAGDPLTVTCRATYARYPAPLLRAASVGSPTPAQRAIHAVAAEALAACIDAARPGATAGSVHDAHARVVDRAGYGRTPALPCGHGLGGVFAHADADWPLLRPGHAAELAVGMALYLEVALFDGDSGVSAALGQTVEITEAGALTLQRKEAALVEV